MVAEQRLREVDYLLNNIRTAEEQLEIMKSSAKGHCCPGCFHGSSYNLLVERQLNRIKWLKTLSEKYKLDIPELKLWLFDYGIK